MSVSVEGVKGYEYQYKITVLIALLRNIEKLELFVEIKGSEDALLKIKQNNIDKEIEIQVKREKNNLDIKKLVGWLCHFQENIVDNNLLDRIINNQNTIALFVTNSRCSDKTVLLKTDIQSIDSHNNINLEKDWHIEFNLCLKNIKLGDTQLKLNREKYCNLQASKIKTKNELENILQKVLIWEEVSDKEIDNEITHILNIEYQIAQSNTNNVYLYLLEVVKKGRDTKENILPKIENILQENKIGRPLINKDYKLRDEETVLLEYLNKNNIILLTGISFCGKSEIAKKIAIYFFDKGYDYKRTNDVEEINRFLLANPKDTKIAILEDPWDHFKPSQRFEEIKRKIIEITKNIQNQHKLIITSKLEILFEIFYSDKVENCKINNHFWFDLTIKDNNNLLNFWTYISSLKSLPVDIVNLVSKNITNSKNHHLLQIGQLSFLANEEIENITNKSYQELEHIARQDSKEIASSLKEHNEFYAEVLAVLALCATPIYSISYVDLAYILSKDLDNISFNKDEFAFSSFHGMKPDFPKYKEDYIIDKNVENAIEYLLERQFIKEFNDQISFSHPNYYEAGRNLIFYKSDTKQKRILAYFEKCLSCLNPTNAYLATKQLSFIYKNIKKSCKEKVITLAFDCHNSIFPSVIDNSLVFLMDFIEKLDQELSNKLIFFIQNGETSNMNIYWHDNEIPFISNKGNMSNFFIKVDDQIVSEVENELKNNRLPNSYKAWIFIECLNNLNVIPTDYIKTLLQYNEAFIRKAVVHQLFKRSANLDNIIIQEVFNDEHPSVVFKAIRTAFTNWFNYPQDMKDIIFELIKSSLNKRQVSIRAFNLIATFAIDYGSESILNWREFDEEQKRELWALWGNYILLQLEIYH